MAHSFALSKTKSVHISISCVFRFIKLTTVRRSRGDPLQGQWAYGWSRFIFTDRFTKSSQVQVQYTDLTSAILSIKLTRVSRSRDDPLHAFPPPPPPPGAAGLWVAAPVAPALMELLGSVT